MCAAFLCASVFYHFSQRKSFLLKKKVMCVEKFGLYPTPIPKDKVEERKMYDHRFSISNYDNAKRERHQMCKSFSQPHEDTKLEHRGVWGL